MDTVEAGGLSVAKALYDFMNDEALPETGLAVERFWDGLGAIIRGFAPRNRKLLDLRDTLQARIDDFHRARRGRPFDVAGGTWISGSPVGCAARRRSARECGRCRIVWPTC